MENRTFKFNCGCEVTYLGVQPAAAPAVIECEGHEGRENRIAFQEDVLNSAQRQWAEALASQNPGE